MANRIHFPYKMLQELKLAEYERFFNSLNGSKGEQYSTYLNHLGEINWMTKSQAAQQHEFFEFVESPLLRFKKKLKPASPAAYQELPPEEREMRLQFRAYLEKKILGEVQPETLQLLSVRSASDITWQHALDDEEIENIPITLETYKSSTGWGKLLLLFAILMIAGITIAAAFFMNGTAPQTGSLIIESNVNGAEVYLDGEKKGYADFKREFSDVPIGKHQVVLRKSGFNSFPHVHEVDVKPKQPVIVLFRMEKILAAEQGFLWISADYDDSKIFINNDFHGTLNEINPLSLTQGEYTIAIEKDGYQSSPESRRFSITPGDTVKLIFDQTPVLSKRASSGSKESSLQKGLIKITANVRGAQIYLNNQNTGKESDYLFSELPFGKYEISLVKGGYRSIPPKKVLTLSNINPKSEIDFKLVKEVETVIIRTQPEGGEIFIDNEPRGKGLFEGDLKTGNHRVSFGDLAGYRTPSPRSISVRANNPLEIAVDYFPEMQYSVDVGSNGNVRINNCDLIPGYTYGNRGFIASQKDGPEIEFEKKLNDYFWKLGFTFPLRDPKGNDALRLNFTLPQELNYAQSFTLKLYAATSTEYFPYSVNKRASVTIKFNNNVLRAYQPKSFEALNGMEELTWDVTAYVKSGLNSFEISTGDDNDAYYFIKRIVIFN